MSVALKFGKDAKGFNTFGANPSVNLWSAVLTDGDVTSITVPETEPFWTVNFRYQGGTVVWVSTTGGAAEEPIGNTLTATNSEMNPATLNLPAGATISMVTGNTTAAVGVVMWKGVGS